MVKAETPNVNGRGFFFYSFCFFFKLEDSAIPSIAALSRGAAWLTFCYLPVSVHSVWVHLKTIRTPPPSANTPLEAIIKAARYKHVLECKSLARSSVVSLYLHC